MKDGKPVGSRVDSVVKFVARRSQSKWCIPHFGSQIKIQTRTHKLSVMSSWTHQINASHL